MIKDKIWINKQLPLAYKKLKSSIYYDKTQLVLRDKLVEYELNFNGDLSKRFEEIAELLCGENEQWIKYENEILKEIDVLCYPKKINKKTGKNIITNISKKNTEIKELQYFIDLDIEGQLIGVLWCLLIGKKIDAELYDHSYGNRMNKKSIEENGNVSKSPYLFRPYFEQYESWRDNGLNIAQESLKHGNDVIIITMDFYRYFYSVDINKNRYDDIFNNNVQADECIAFKRIHDFVYGVIEKYSAKLGVLSKELSNNKFLPIGFYPSYILSNWYLDNFDKAIVNRWNPLYYGRYVDDVIIVDKVEKNSDIYLEAKKGELDRDFILDYYLCNCNSFKNIHCDNKTAILVKDSDANANIENNQDEQSQEVSRFYNVNNDILCDSIGNIRLQNDKVKVFYFNQDYTDALIDNFRKEIAKNKSEFRFLPEDEAVLYYDDYSDIYKIKSNDTLNKFRGIDEVELNKFELSKFLGKYLRMSIQVNDKKELKFEKDIQRIFNNVTIIDNYTTWEKVIEVLLLDNKLEILYEFITKIVEAIINIKYVAISDASELEEYIKTTMMKTLISALVRPLSLCWGKEIKKTIDKIENFITNKMFDNNILLNNILSIYSINKIRRGYCITRMADKNAMPILIDAIINNLKIDSMLSDDNDLNLSNFSECVLNATNLNLENKDYLYYPYTISPQDIEICLILDNIQNCINNNMLINSQSLFDNENKIFSMMNGFKPEAKVFFKKSENDNKEYIKVGSGRKKKVSVAIANTKLKSSNFNNVLLDNPDRSYARYIQTVKLINEAIKYKVNILVLPEAFMPFEWLPIIARTCAKVDLALVTGIEHIKLDKTIINLTATILPYKTEDYSFAYINMHNKVHYSPEEKFQIESYGYKYFEGANYSIFNWNDIWFSIFCCYELTSIIDRSLFMSENDILIAVEWNHDINYYSNIVESLSRDLHCYCVQVNTSDYGDSRIMRPSKTVEKDVIRTKGGKNSTILIEELDIDALRKFQVKGYSLQKDDKMFKPTPPQIDVSKIRKKIKGVYWDELD